MASDPTAVLLISCPDRPGLVAAVANFVAEHGGNIIHADQHTDLTTRTFVQRVEWELNGYRIPRDEVARAFQPVADRFSMTWTLHFTGEPIRVGLLVSRMGHCLDDLLSRWKRGELPIEVPLVASNHADLQASADRFAVPFHHLPVAPEDRAIQESSLQALLEDSRIDFIVLARYMQILSPEFVARWPGRIINIHHSFLPAFAGARPYHQAHDRGVKVIGATAHYVTSQLDEGPIIAQDVTTVSHRDSVEDLVRKGRDLETVVLARAVRLHIEHRLIVVGNRTVVFD